MQRFASISLIDETHCGSTHSSGKVVDKCHECILLHLVDIDGGKAEEKMTFNVHPVFDASGGSTSSSLSLFFYQQRME